LHPDLSPIDARLLPRLDADAKYHVYVDRQQKDIERQREDERLEIPPDFDFESISGLSNELKLKFRKNRPTTIGHASRLEGVTPAALLLLAAHARRLRKTASQPSRGERTCFT
jgi:tRNA uridine 5-carboxymethylaminomethyl modification enzyme